MRLAGNHYMADRMDVIAGYPTKCMDKKPIVDKDKNHEKCNRSN
jgi:hypothetical protein